MNKKLILAIALLVLILAGFVCIKFYPYVFAKNVSGVILNVERVNQPDTIISNGMPVPPGMINSFAVSVRDDSGEIHTASSEDRQWTVAQPGQCVEAKFFRYPPWDLKKGGTFFDARLERLFDCKKK